MEQSFFNYDLKPKLTINDFYVSHVNKEAYQIITKDKIYNQKLLLIGPNKSGKTHLGNIWQKVNKALIYNNNLEEVLNCKRNIFIDNLFINMNEEYIFHIINHCSLNNLNLLFTSNSELFDYNFKLQDLSSRLKTFNILRIYFPDDKLIINLMIKLLYDKQIIINNPEIFQYILKRIPRTYDHIFLLVESIDKLSLEKKRELTIPLIKELI